MVLWVRTQSWFRARSTSSSNSLGVSRSSDPGAKHTAPGLVDGDLADDEGPRPLTAGHAASAERDPDARQQLLGPERLGDVVVGTEVERLHFVGLGTARGQDEDRHGRRRSHPAADLGTLEIRQPEIEDDQIGRAIGSGLKRLHAGPRDFDFVAAGPQQRRHRSLNRGLVIDEQDAGWRAHQTSAGSGLPARTSAGTTIVNTAPPSGAFSPQTRPPAAATSPRTIREAHASARRPFLAFAPR